MCKSAQLTCRSLIEIDWENGAALEMVSQTQHSLDEATICIGQLMAG